jgi:nitroreductase
MDTLDAIGARRAVKHYDAAHQFTQEETDALFDAVLLSPTSFNIQNWRIVNVTDEATRARLRGVAWDQAQVTDASMLLVLCGDTQSWNDRPERYWRNAPQETQDMIVPMIGEFYRGKDQLQRDEVIRSVGIAAQSLMLTAKSLGYDSCPMIGFDPDAVGEIINLPDGHVIGMMLSIGKAASPARPRGGALERDDVVFENGF